ncbi:hypothetical protein CsatB_011280 [Cannabis sativa]|uniref:phenylacetaldehyde oxime monooxygenase CYP71AN24-like n=1 Tax=Cannabis sativa TaxID=3483 RepID=UPI0011E05F49|nr:phenylacetaldehyde oxime monooxygenase CYP71AN24-like [Cannabis sativa]
MQYPMLFPISIFFVSLIILFTRFRSRTKFNLPPSPPRLPLIGNLRLLRTHPHHSLRTLLAKYGPLMLLQMGQVPTLVVSSSEMVKEIVKKHDVVFSDRPKTSAADIFCYGDQDVGFAPYGEYWRQARKICVLELLSHKRVQQFHLVRKEETDVLSFVEENGRSKFGELTRKVMEDFEAFSLGDFFPRKYLSWIDVVTGFTELDLQWGYGFLFEISGKEQGGGRESPFMSTTFIGAFGQMRQQSRIPYTEWGVRQVVGSFGGALGGEWRSFGLLDR